MSDAALNTTEDQDEIIVARMSDEVDTEFASLVELLLKDQSRVDQLSRIPIRQREIIPKFLAIGMLGYFTFGVALAVIFGVARVWPELQSVSIWLKDTSDPLVTFAALDGASWWQPMIDGSAICLIAAFALGLIGSIGVCLPSFYFYGLLAGVRTTMLHVTLISLKGMVTGAIALIGILPVYFAIALGMIVFESPAWSIELMCYLGFALPFIAGVWGTRALYRAFVDLADTMRVEDRCQRTWFLQKLLLSWSLCFTAVTPVMIYTLWEYFERWG